MEGPIRTALQRLTVSSTYINLLLALYLVCFLNGPFWRIFSKELGTSNAGNWLFLFMVGAGICLILNGIFSLFSYRPLYKPVVITLLLVSAVVNYYMVSYGIVIDDKMIVNLLETDFREASEQLTWPFFRHTLVFGLLPAALLLIIQVKYRPWRRELLERSLIITGSALLILLIVFSNFKSLTLFGREHKHLRMYINPTYPVYSLVYLLKKRNVSNAAEPVKIIAPDAGRPVTAKKSLLVLVVGETARAEQFSLNGYHRKTTPELEARDVFNFTNVDSCGTDTAESLPCMFSHLGRSNYSRSAAGKYENILDILQRTGVKVVWRDNNSGSKGIAERVAYESLAFEKDPLLCSAEECFDEILLKDFVKLIEQNQGEMLLVLHQKGSHGPSYYKRSPQIFKQYTPECTQDNVQDCEPATIVNAYDNTIRYTDHFLAALIDRLKQENYPTAMLYASDHGESLGENNIYLHGLPYLLAPSQQTHIPMIFWGSDSYLRDKGIDRAILTKHLKDHFSHDFLFHTLLGLFGVKTAIYQQDFDIFSAK